MNKRGGKRKGAGRKAKDAQGEKMSNRTMRFTDTGWKNLKTIGADKARELIDRAAQAQNKPFVL